MRDRPPHRRSPAGPDARRSIPSGGAVHVAVVDLASGAVNRHRSEAPETAVVGAFCLVRDQGVAIGIEIVAGSDARSDKTLVATLRTRRGLQVATEPTPSDDLYEDVTIVVASRNGADKLESTLPAMLSLSYPNFRVMVVDNAPRTSATRQLVQRLRADDSRLSYLCEPLPGLSRARNRGLDAVSTPLVAFLDDDVTPEPDYLRVLCAPFVSRPEVWCCSGSVLPISLDTEAERLFERFGGFTSGPGRREFRRRMRPRPSSLFPYSPGLFGTGGSLSFRTHWLRSLAGFDVRLGAGTPAQGGEDLDITMRIVRAGGVLIYEPHAVVWHQHHRDYPTLVKQVGSYGAGLSAVFTKLLLSPSTAPGVLRRLPRGLALLLSPKSDKNARRGADYPQELVRRELLGITRGWFGYLHSTVRGAKIAQLHASGSDLR